eukprot:g3170.t1
MAQPDKKTLSQGKRFAPAAEAWWANTFGKGITEVPVEDLAIAMRRSPFNCTAERRQTLINLVQKVICVNHRGKKKKEKGPPYEGRPKKYVTTLKAKSSTALYTSSVANPPVAPPSLVPNSSVGLYSFYDAKPNAAEVFVEKSEFVWFVVRTGPLSECVKRALDNFYCNGELVPWFHGHVDKTSAKALFRESLQRFGTGGLFFVRYSASVKTSYTVTCSCPVKARENRLKLFKFSAINLGSDGFYFQVNDKDIPPKKKYAPTIPAFIAYLRSHKSMGIFFMRPLPEDMNVTTPALRDERLATMAKRESEYKRQRDAIHAIEALVAGSDDKVKQKASNGALRGILENGNARRHLKRVVKELYPPLDADELDVYAPCLYSSATGPGLTTKTSRVHSIRCDVVATTSPQARDSSYREQLRGLLRAFDARAAYEIEGIAERRRKNRTYIMFDSMTMKQDKDLQMAFQTELLVTKYLSELLMGRLRDALASTSLGDVGDDDDEEKTSICTHPYLELWTTVGKDGKPQKHFHCADCKKRVDDEKRAAFENKWIQKIYEEDKDLFVVDVRGATESASSKEAWHTSALARVPKVDVNKSAAQSIHRGVSVRWLVEWTCQNDCWNMPTWKVKRDFVMPATSARRCRYVDLDVCKGSVGKASTFVSHCWGAKWGVLVAAVAEQHADFDRFVWIDIFAVRQWPGNAADLNFKNVIELCSSFLLVCEAVPSISRMTMDDIMRQNIASIPANDRRKIAFFRVWCLVEIAAAREYSVSKEHDLNVVMKCGELGRYPKKPSDTMSGALVSDGEMIDRLSILVDVAKAEATVESDKERIMTYIGKSLGQLNKMVRATCLAAHSACDLPVIQTAACGDFKTIKAVQDELADAKSLYTASAGGYLNVVKYLVEERGFSPEIRVRAKEDRTSLIRAVIGGHDHVVEYFLRTNSSDGFVNGIDRAGKTALHYAASNGHAAVAKLLLARGASLNVIDDAGVTPLIEAAKNGQANVVEFLLEKGARKSDVDNTGRNALMWARRVVSKRDPKYKTSARVVAMLVAAAARAGGGCDAGGDRVSGIAAGVSRIDYAFCEPFQLFGEECVSQLTRAAESGFFTDCEYSTARTSACLRGCEPLEHLVESVRPALEAKMSQIIGRKMRIHPITFERAHLNVQREAQTKPVDGWHQDSTPFVLVTVLTNHEEDAGGSLLVRANSGAHEDEDLTPAFGFRSYPGSHVARRKILRAKSKRPGQAMLMQGSHIWHCAEASQNGKRLTMVTSFVCDSPAVYDTTSVRIALLYSPPLKTLVQLVRHALGRIEEGSEVLLRKVVEGEKRDARDVASVLCREISKLRGATFEIAELLARGQNLQIGKRVPDLSILGVPLTCLASAAKVLGHHLSDDCIDFSRDPPSIEWASALNQSAEAVVQGAKSAMVPFACDFASSIRCAL